MRFRFWRALVGLAMLTQLADPFIVEATVLTPSLPPAILISELQTASTNNAGEEFVELYNASSNDVLLTGWTIEYKAATSTDAASSWSKRASLSGNIKSHGFYLVAAKVYLTNADAEWSPTLASSAGVVRVKDGTGAVVELLGYGSTANVFETAAAAAPAAGLSLERLPGKTDETAGNGVDSGNNALDFVVRTTPQPQSMQSVFEPNIGEGSTDPTSTPDTQPADGPVLAPPQITELFVNPAAPLSDDKDEFIELFNPNGTAFNLAGYILDSGSNFHDSYILPATVIPANSYLALYSSQTKLSLVNGGGAAKLVDPQGALLDQSTSYGNAPEAQSWSLGENGWAWTIDVTPGAPNILVIPVVATTNSASKSVLKTKSSSKAATKTAAKPKSTTKTKTAKTATAKSATTKADSAPVSAATWLIIVIATLTIGYAIYEYRQDIERLYHKLRGNSQDRPEIRPVDARRRDS